MRSPGTDEHKSRFLLNSQATHALMCSLSQEDYSKVHNFRSAKQIWDTLVITYEGSFEVKCNKLSLLTCKCKLFSMEEAEDIKTMFGCFQSIMNELQSLGRHYANYHHIDKILWSLSRKWRPQVTILRAIKNLDSMTLEELVGILKDHEKELA